jgi:mono/diheme cytochrome c family protein
VATGAPLESQIGPVTELELGPYDPSLAAEGERSFKLRCSACHALDRELVGPPLGGILGARTPVYVMNMIVNPTEMLERHPVAQALLEKYAVPMADLGVSEEDAREILEYLRGEGAAE